MRERETRLVRQSVRREDSRCDGREGRGMVGLLHAGIGTVMRPCRARYSRTRRAGPEKRWTSGEKVQRGALRTLRTARTARRMMVRVQKKQSGKNERPHLDNARSSPRPVCVCLAAPQPASCTKCKTPPEASSLSSSSITTEGGATRQRPRLLLGRSVSHPHPHVVCQFFRLQLPPEVHPPFPFCNNVGIRGETTITQSYRIQ
ncbi:hypothetical protein BXZ70DRAFT_198903 [Cristinia sonorae]|uniref:Uncharacterized protein n=1 Tax=Cristinia sonorae TaxID=1940300 RepID=A0A8K0UPN6_9AGAR|nr:hypothetical protein BXZ70DRAFT_198903 [Cristinia sonorae]